MDPKLLTIEDGEPSTFFYDEQLDSLPLPTLEGTLDRYYKSLIPFGSEEELENSRKIIEEFQNGIGRKLHSMLEEKAKKEKNWVEKYWMDHAYLSLRLPITPYCAMVQPLMTSFTNIDTSREKMLKNFSRIVIYALEFWILLRDEKLRPGTSVDGKMHFSSDQFRRVFNTARVPGIEKDELACYFKTKPEKCPSHVVVLGNGRIFYFGVMKKDKLISPQEMYHALSIIYNEINREKKLATSIPLLTNDDRTSWSKNRQHLMEISKDNENYFRIIESAVVSLSFDTTEPADVSEHSQHCIDGDYHSRWNDKSSGLVAFQNGLFGFVGEHSCFDGALSYSPFILMKLMDEPEPDWSRKCKLKIFPIEIEFKVDEIIRKEVVRVEEFKKSIKKNVVVHFGVFNTFGKGQMKEQNIHPDCFVQMAIQLAYHKLHGKLVPTYETATMRNFYHGRTETVRTCTTIVKEWIDKMTKENISKSEKAAKFRTAANSHLQLMGDARVGKGIDRHIFALWCTAYENNIPIPSFYDDPMYSKSGGGGNFVLSTSTLGYFINIGFVAPMVLDGYGVFYIMLDDCIWMIASAYRDSEETSSKKFYEAFDASMKEIMNVLAYSSESKL